MSIIPESAIETIKKKRIPVEVKSGVDYWMEGTVLALTIKRFEEQPERSPNEIMTEIISERFSGESKKAIVAGLNCSKFLDQLSDSHGGKYIHIDVVLIDDGLSECTGNDMNDLAKSLADIIGKDRVHISIHICGDAAKGLEMDIEEVMASAQAAWYALEEIFRK